MNNESLLIGTQPAEVLNETLLTETQAAEVLDVVPGTLAVWRCTKRYNIPYIKIGRNVRYSRRALLEWLENRTHGVEV